MGSSTEGVTEGGGLYNPPEFGLRATSSAIVVPEIIVAPQVEDVSGGPDPRCGDGVLGEDELCDPSLHPCCNEACDGVLRPGELCREADGVCDAAELCDGASFLCPEDALEAEGTVCRQSAGECDQSERCDGESNDCPRDGFEDRGTVCREADGECDLEESCTGDTAECPADAVVPASEQVVCRAADGDLACDAVERCDGEAKACPADAPLAAGTQCQTSLGTCDAAEVCDGESFDCPPPTGSAAPRGTMCRISDGPCDLAETCDGTSITCPVDGFRPATFECRPDSAMGCDVAERCTGASAVCPPNGYRPAEAPCRAAAAGGCDVAESCFGDSPACPVDRFAQGNVCRAEVAGGCDREERCDGERAACPSDVVEESGTVCRAGVAGGCDIAEMCNGTAPTCPSNVVEVAGTVCRTAVAGGCDIAETCNGTAATCPSDAVQESGVVCRPAATGGCDVAERCAGTNACPANGFASRGTVCRAAAAGDLCDAEETCPGATAMCPADGRIPENGACNDDLGQCSRDVCCPGETTNDGDDRCEILGSNIVFVTSMDVDGSLPGVAAADALCNQLARGANLSSTFHAWISANPVAVPAPMPIHARDRVSRGPYTLVSDVDFSPSINDLIRGGEPLAPLNRTEWNVVRDVPVWTATRTAGVFDQADCVMWSSTVDAGGDVGQSGSMTGTWTDNTTRACALTAALYCFQDDCPGLANVDFLQDPNNCGACGNVCELRCLDGQCTDVNP